MNRFVIYSLSLFFIATPILSACHACSPPWIAATLEKPSS